MAKDKYYGKTLRKNFARHEEVMAMPTCWRSRRSPISGSWIPVCARCFADVASIVDYAGNLGWAS